MFTIAAPLASPVFTTPSPSSIRHHRQSKSPTSTSASRLRPLSIKSLHSPSLKLSQPLNPFQTLLKSTPTISPSIKSIHPTPRISQQPQPFKNIINSSTTFLSVAAGTAATLTFFLHCGGGGGRGFGGGGGGGNGGGGGGSFWSRIFSLSPAIADDEKSSDWDTHGLPANIKVQLNKLSALKKYKMSDILFFDRQHGFHVGNEDSFFDMVSLRPGGVYTKAQLQKELETLSTCGMFEKVDIEGKTNPDGTMAVAISFIESTWKRADGFKCINVGMLEQPKNVKTDNDMTEKEKIEYFRSQGMDYKRRIEKSRKCLLPVEVEKEIADAMRRNGKVSARLLQKIKDKVQYWYHENGYACAQVVNFGNLDTNEVVCEVVEGDITKMEVQFQDKLGNVCEGNTQVDVVKRQLPKLLRQGQVFNIEAGKQALRNINSLALFDQIEVNPRPDEKNDGGIIVEIKLKESEHKSSHVATQWNIVPGLGWLSTLASIQPGGTVYLMNKNIKGLNRSIVGSVTSNNFLNPEDDMTYNLEYVHPYLDGVKNPRERTLRSSFFNTRKMSPVFTGGPGLDEVPPVWVDRSGVKTTITENFTPQSKFTYGLVVEDIKTRDENNNICAKGQRVLPSGAISANGPPTTLSGTGTDQMAFLQANITRDNTKFVNGAIVGERNVFQVDQGLGIGRNFPFFNRHQLAVTKFLPLKKVEEGPGKLPPPVLVLHGLYGGCVGDLPNYDAFTLGGDHSVRGYKMGELGAARNKLELAAELRIPVPVRPWIPVPVRNGHFFAFAEHGNDLGSSKDVKGNPTEVSRRLGHGSSCGLGVNLGMLRVGYAVDKNSGKGAFVFRYGDRF